MKRSLQIFLCVFLLLSNLHLFGTDIREALKRKVIEADVQWKYPDDAESVSQQHGCNLRVSIQNISHESQSIEIPCGFMFTPIDSSKQNMIITEDMTFVISPSKTLSKYAHGYCCEATDGAPQQGEVYAIKKNSGDLLIKLTQFLRDKNISDYGAQRAIWCVSNNHDLWNINATDSSKTAEVIEFTGKLKGVPNSDIATAKKVSIKKNGHVFEKMIHIEIPIEHDQFVWIEIHDINNSLRRCVAQKQAVKKGILEKDIGVSSLNLGFGSFAVRVYSSDGFVMEQKFKL